MLNLIRIRNYAIVDEVEVEFGPGFNVMTGETGAGKSILVDALGLALGDRADSAAVRHGADKAEISVVFDCPDAHPALAWLADHELADGTTCSMRRVVSAEGRSRAFINNQPVTLQDLRELGSMLVEIHGQHAHQSLLEAAEQRALLDAAAGASDLAGAVAEAFETWQRAIERLDASRTRSAERDALIERLRFEHAELAELELTEGELEALQAEHHRLANIDELAVQVQTALDCVYESETDSAHALIVRAIHSLEAIGELDAELNAYTGQLRNAEIEVRDVASSLTRYRDTIEPDPDRLAHVEARLARIRSLARRHRVEEPELWRHATELGAQLQALDASSESIDALAARAASAERDFGEKAAALSKLRHKHAKRLAREVSAQVKNLGLPHGEFDILIEPKPKPDSHGIDRIEFRVRLNPGHPFGEIGRVASGGELSRIGLALRVVAVGGSSVPTFVFDEVDAGIGGGVAEIVGMRLRELAAQRQVLCVTHLAQVASRGHRHYRIVKSTDGKTSRTDIAPLGQAERVDELSRMIGGVEITAKTRAHAAEMIARAKG
jgi:DNA repair protein RecN (Recombination protein N)